MALLASLDKTKKIETIESLKATIEKMPDSKLKDALLSLGSQAGKDIDKLRMGVATWFDDSMDRLSGAYKRQIKLISFLIGLCVAVGFNADTIKVADTLWKDGALRAQMVSAADELAKQKLTSQQSAPDSYKALLAEINDTQSSLRMLPIGWGCEAKKFDDKNLEIKPSWAVQFDCTEAKSAVRISLLQIIGWLLTAGALSFGAPFWFDLLNKFINIRNAGTKPARADGTPA
jgi:hypothetical protein